MSFWTPSAWPQDMRSCTPRDATLVGERECLRRFLVLVTGTLVYSKGDKMEAKAEGLLGEGEERLFAPVAAADPGQAQPAAVPGAHRRSSIGTAPIAMRATPGSLKARPAHPPPARWPCQHHNSWQCATASLEADSSVGALPVAMQAASGSAHLHICEVFACAPHPLGSP